ncbi:MAG: zinc-binding alcohol dehydrogenase family protein [Chloroflexota bacterium]
MKAIGINWKVPDSDPEGLIDLELPKPVSTGRDLLVAIKAVAVNPADLGARQRRGDSDKNTATILGYDAAGVVEAVGLGVDLFKPGDEVYYAGDVNRPGSNAEYQLVDERIVGRKPTSLDFAQAAALPLTALTAYEAFFDRLHIDSNGANNGETLLIIGGAGGVGSIGIQLAKIAGLTVIATASRPESIGWVQSLGADHVISHREPLRPQIEALGLNFIDHIAVFNSMDKHSDAVTDLIRPQGMIVSIVGPPQPKHLERFMWKSAGFVSELMFTRAMFQTPDMIEQHHLLNRIAAWIDNGTIRTTVNEVLTPITAENLREAHAMVKSGSSIGKVVLAEWLS